jgi:hypothetical protein
MRSPRAQRRAIAGATLLLSLDVTLAAAAASKRRPRPTRESGSRAAPPCTAGDGERLGGSCDRASFTFSGTRVSVIGYRDEWGGLGRVFVDGVLAGTADFYDPGYQAQAVAFTSSTLGSGAHWIG